MNTPNESRLKSAYHEAGHAVAGWYHGAFIQKIVLEKGSPRLYIKHSGTNYWEVTSREDLLDGLLILLAGPAATERFNRQSKQSPQVDPNVLVDLDDLKEAIYLLSRQDIDQGLKKQGFHRKRVLDDPETDNMETLQTFYKEFGDPARQFIVRSDVWKCVTAIASELVRKKHLSGKEAVHLAENTWNQPVPEKARPACCHESSKEA